MVFDFTKQFGKNKKEGINMTTALVIIAIILSFGGGVFVGNKTAPKEIKQITYNVSSANSYAVAANIDVEKSGVHKHITVSIEGTNIEVYIVTNGQKYIIPPDEVLPSWVPKFPKIE